MLIAILVLIVTHAILIYLFYELVTALVVDGLWQGPPGPPGPKGDKGEPGESGEFRWATGPE